MPASIRRLVTSLILASATFPAIAPAAQAAEETIVMTAPFASDDTSGSCAAVACNVDGSADRETGELAVEVAALAGDLTGYGDADAISEASITAAHEVSDDVQAIRYEVVLEVDEAIVSAQPEGGQVRISTKVSHSEGIELEGGVFHQAPFTGGLLVHQGEALFACGLEVRPTSGQTFAAGTLGVEVTLSGLVIPRTLAAGGELLAGRVQSGFTLQRVEATLVS